MPPTGVPQAEYVLYLYDTTGTQQAVFATWQALTYTQRVNEPGSFQIDARQDANVGLPLDALPSILVEDAIILIRRRIPGFVDWYTDAVGLVRDVAFDRDDAGNLTFRAKGVGPLDLVARRVVAYPAGTKQVDKRGASDTVIAAYVDENVGNLATVPLGRYASGVTPGFTVTAAAGTGTTWDGSRHMQNVLAVIQGISLQTADVEFAVTAAVGSGSVAWTFATVTPQIGTDRSATVIFSESMGNLGAPKYSNAKTQAKNRVYVLGPGEKADRIVLTANSLTRQAGSPWALAETTHEATQERTGASMANVGATKLEQTQPWIEFAFSPIETLATRYGRDYFLGDTVTAIAQDGTVLTLRVIGVTIRSDGASGAESISLDVRVLR